ncbi:SH3 domain-containing protein [Litorisediminicola beolgyonensis]|uniref:SH3 domain-containing protein n=1 Tax=Litorisediminicola beolgyonensis TaxID=1173614 RepID=A0ABW3ZHP9_9RHOB
MIRWVLICLACLTGPAAATQDQWPALFDVAGVAADDVLNIRAEPSASAPIVGTLAPDAVDIEVIRPNPRELWGLVNVEDGTGWVSLSYLRRQPGQYLGALLEPRTCVGTEPFWSLSLTDAARVTYEVAADQTVLEGTVPGRFRSANRRDVEALSLTFFDGTTGTAFLRLDQCSDGMSDRAFGISIDLLLKHPERPVTPSLVSGCCSLN